MVDFAKKQAKMDIAYLINNYSDDPDTMDSIVGLSYYIDLKHEEISNLKSKIKQLEEEDDG